MRKFPFSFFCIITIITISFFPSPTFCQQQQRLHGLRIDSLNVDQIERGFYYDAPDNISQHPGLLFVIHGSGMNAWLMKTITGNQFGKIADSAKNIIIVYPQGYLKYWNDCRKSATYDTKLQNINDVEFFVKMIDYFSTTYHINRQEVFAAGYSNGGEMCYKLAEEKPELFKGFAAISANLPVETNNDCFQSNQPVSMLVMNGTSDPINPYNGGAIILPDGKNRGTVVSTNNTIDYWTSLDKCDTASKTIHQFPDPDQSDSSVAIEEDYTCRVTNKKITLIKIINGGHIIPNPRFHFWPKVLGNVNKDINAPQIIFDYFMSLQ